MPRSRVLSFMSQWGAPRSPPTDKSNPPSNVVSPQNESKKPRPISLSSPQAYAQRFDYQSRDAPGSPTAAITPSRARGDSRVGTRPESMIQPHQPIQTEVTNDTPPELQPIFTFLNSHSNKLYQEGYFLKLHDLDSRGRPSTDRAWIECFAQLVGTVLSLWDAAALDAAGEDGEVVPTFVNLSDASIKMIESLPMNGAQGGNLQNVLSVSTAANNRYLLHFNSLNSLTQWTAAIRLAMFEHSTLHEAYTGSLIAGKGRYLNNIKSIMERARFSHEDWARVRFGAGTSWKRYWCVITPPDEKEMVKAQKTMKKAAPYERMRAPKGDIKFYDTRKVTKKTKPIATITDAFAAYAIYPQSKPLIDQSTLVKLEGLVTIHSSPESTTEGFVFVMPEVHAAVTGFEMMLRWLFPVYDTFNLYGRPNRLVADTLDQRGLMFAMPRNRRYGYLDTLDVSALIHTKGSQAWSERQWRREMKKLTSDRMNTQSEASPRESMQMGQRRNAANRMSLPPIKGGVTFEDGALIQSTPGSRSESPLQLPGTDGHLSSPKRTDSAPPGASQPSPHKRSVSEAVGYRKFMAERNRGAHEHGDAYEENLQSPPRYDGPGNGFLGLAAGMDASNGTNCNDKAGSRDSFASVQNHPQLPPPEPVIAPPSFTHNPNSRPANTPYQAPDLRRAHSNIDPATLHQMQDAVRPNTSPEDEWSGDMQQGQQTPVVSSTSSHNLRQDMTADPSQSLGAIPAANYSRQNAQRQRLSTIPGSPYQNQEASHSQSSVNRNNRQIDGMLNERPRNSGDDSRHGSPSRSIGNQSIARKPLPTQLSLAGEDRRRMEIDGMLPEFPSGHGSFTGAVLDSDALEHILNNPNDDRSRTMESHASSATPDYASTSSAGVSRRDRESFEKPRTGKLKTVGNPEYQLPSQNTDRYTQDNSIPDIDFGPTYTYRPHARGDSGGSISPVKAGDAHFGSNDRLEASSRDRPSTAGGLVSAGETHRHSSYYGGRSTPNMDDLEGLNTPGNRHSIAWQPSAGSPGGAARHSASLSAEQWVQHRAALANQPQLPPPRRGLLQTSHNRQGSTQSVSPLRQAISRTPPPLSRTPSGDWAHLTNRTTPPSRPNSRGSGMLLNSQPSSTQAPNLTAKEQMQVARATNTPLISYTTSLQRKESEQYAPGLFGALASRDREKESNMAGNRNSLVVQQAITARQQQLEMEAEAHARAQYQMQMQQHVQQLQQMQQTQYQQLRGQNQAPPNYQQPRATVHPNQGSWQQQQRISGQPSSTYGMQGTPPGNMMNTLTSSRNYQRQGPPPPQHIIAQQPGGAQQYTQQQRRA
ncbi:Hypothetical protein R9X50_00386700 [Acrodontium crateriforme]|uniref:PH domain-containing protein n=1 Tax=Acrodontium crateriforme TaxID=150365 RepID=A0AAQ3RC86_9PEZI|nr:Hypothetical protein R9X50_00386700 [Acrodontium crateriforme]